jgi:hypothetical protein
MAQAKFLFSLPKLGRLAPFFLEVVVLAHESGASNLAHLSLKIEKT